jgi:hypothetical protein
MQRYQVIQCSDLIDDCIRNEGCLRELVGPVNDAMCNPIDFFERANSIRAGVALFDAIKQQACRVLVIYENHIFRVSRLFMLRKAERRGIFANILVWTAEKTGTPEDTFAIVPVGNTHSLEFE